MLCRVWPSSHGLSYLLLMGHCVVGAVRDISFLIDFLPSYMYPTDERHVVRWGVIGVSLGGHATWIALKEGKSTQHTVNNEPLMISNGRTSTKFGYSYHWQANR